MNEVKQEATYKEVSKIKPDRCEDVEEILRLLDNQSS